MDIKKYFLKHCLIITVIFFILIMSGSGFSAEYRVTQDGTGDTISVEEFNAGGPYSGAEDSVIFEGVITTPIEVPAGMTDVVLSGADTNDPASTVVGAVRLNATDTGCMLNALTISGGVIINHASRTVLNRCIVRNAPGNGISITASDEIRIYNCLIYQNGGSGIEVNSEQGNPFNIYIAGNTIADNYLYGIKKTFRDPPIDDTERGVWYIENNIIANNHSFGMNTDDYLQYLAHGGDLSSMVQVSLKNANAYTNVIYNGNNVWKYQFQDSHGNGYVGTVGENTDREEGIIDISAPEDHPTRKNWGLNPEFHEGSYAIGTESKLKGRGLSPLDYQDSYYVQHFLVDLQNASRSGPYYSPGCYEDSSAPVSLSYVPIENTWLVFTDSQAVACSNCTNPCDDPETEDVEHCPSCYEGLENTCGLLVKWANEHGKTVYAYGVGGSVLWSMSHVIDAAIQEHRPSHVVFSFGMNDMGTFGGTAQQFIDTSMAVMKKMKDDWGISPANIHYVNPYPCLDNECLIRYTDLDGDGSPEDVTSLYYPSCGINPTTDDDAWVGWAPTGSAGQDTDSDHCGVGVCTQCMGGANDGYWCKTDDQCPGGQCSRTVDCAGTDNDRCINNKLYRAGEVMAAWCSSQQPPFSFHDLGVEIFAFNGGVEDPDANEPYFFPWDAIHFSTLGHKRLLQAYISILRGRRQVYVSLEGTSPLAAGSEEDPIADDSERTYSSYINEALLPGDELYYKGNNTWNGTLSARQGITYGSFGGERAVFDASTSEYGIIVQGEDNITLKNLFIKNALIDNIRIEGGSTVSKNITIEGCKVDGAGNSGIILSGVDNGTIEDCEVANNTLDGINLSNGSVVSLVNNLIFNNNGYGIGINDSGSSAEVINDTIADNINTGVFIGEGSEAFLSNSIIWSNGDDINISSNSTVEVKYCNIGDGDYSGVDGNISEDPLFAGDVDYHLIQGSPSIDSGTPNNAPMYDIEGVKRPHDGNSDGIADYDMGAYEYAYYADLSVGDGFGFPGSCEFEVQISLGNADKKVSSLNFMLSDILPPEGVLSYDSQSKCQTSGRAENFDCNVIEDNGSLLVEIKSENGQVIPEGEEVIATIPFCVGTEAFYGQNVLLEPSSVIIKDDLGSELEVYLHKGEFIIGCSTDSDCSDGSFCNGQEVCYRGVCQQGSAPCGSGYNCDEQQDKCVSSDGSGGSGGGGGGGGSVNEPPEVPLGPQPADGSHDQPTDGMLTWESSLDPDGDTVTYDLYLGNSIPPMLVSSDITRSRYSYQDLGPDTTYYWQVIAKDTAGNQAKGPTWSFQTSSEGVLNNYPTPPENPKPANGSINQPLELILSWDKSTDQDGDSIEYDVYFGAINPPPKVAIGLKQSYYMVKGLEPLKDYYWYVVARDSRDTETSSAVWSFSTNSAQTSEETATIKIYVYDIVRGIPLAGAAAITEPGDVKAFSDEEGICLLEVPEGEYSIIVSADGYYKKTINGVTAQSLIWLNIGLIPQLCPAELTLEENQTALDILRQYRDRILSQTSEGQRLISIYYNIAEDANKFLLNNPELKREFYDILLKVIPVLKRCLTDGNVMVYSQTERDIEKLLQDSIQRANEPLKTELKAIVRRWKENGRLKLLRFTTQ